MTRLLARSFAVLALSCIATGCASEYQLMTAPGVKPAPSAECSFEVSKGLPPATAFVEIGRLEAQFFPAADLEKLRASVHDDVCSIGGELVVGEWDGDHYMGAIVYRRREKPPAANPKPGPIAKPVESTPLPSTPAPVPSSAPPASSANGAPPAL